MIRISINLDLDIPISLAFCTRILNALSLKVILRRLILSIIIIKFKYFTMYR